MDPAHDFLNRLIGKWQLTGTMGDTPLRQSVECRWVLGRQFVELDFKSTLPESQGRQPYQAIYHVGYNAERDLFVLHLLDTFGVPTHVSLGLANARAIQFRLFSPILMDLSRTNSFGMVQPRLGYLN